MNRVDEVIKAWRAQQKKAATPIGATIIVIAVIALLVLVERSM